FRLPPRSSVCPYTTLFRSSGEVIPASLKVWAAGVKAPEFLRDLDGLESNRINQLKVRPTLQTTLDDDIFALGDCAACPLGDGSEDRKSTRLNSSHVKISYA